jgi:rhodanese-related sulfurtransferase
MGLPHYCRFLEDTDMSASISPASLYAQLGLCDSPAVVDVRSEAAFASEPRLIPGSLRAAASEVGRWSKTLPRIREIVVYGCNEYDEATPVADSLTALGHPTFVLEGGLAAWLRAGYATTKARPELKSPGASRWITRERPKIDRLACPWLVRRFIDPDAAFFYTAAHQVRSEAGTLQAEPYDIADVTFSHRGPRCSFDAFLDEFDLHDPALEQLADIVRAADTGELGRSREAPGLLAISLGLSANIPDDIVLLEQAMPLYDALYAWCKKARSETHSWPQTSPRA